VSTTVLYLNPYATIGGAERALLELVGELDRARYTPIVVLGEDGPLVRELAARGIETIVEPFPLPPLHGLVWPPTLARVARAAARLRRLVRARGARILHGGDVVGLLLLVAARPRGARIVYQIHYLGGAARRLALAALALPAVDRLLAVSARQPSRLGPAPGLLAGRTRVLPPGISAPAFAAGDRRAFRREVGAPEGAPLVGLVARHDTWKGHGVFLEAAARLRERRKGVRFVMVGGRFDDDPPSHVRRYRDAFLARRRELGLEDVVALLPHRPDVAGVLAGLDVLVCPSADEPFGMIVLEAMAAGTPVVASDSGGPAEILEDGRSGLLFRTGSASALASAVLRVLDEPGLGARLAAEAGHRVRTAFGSARYAREVEAVYAALA